jgi:hypothetical protein
MPERALAVKERLEDKDIFEKIQPKDIIPILRPLRTPGQSGPPWKS